jgi:hypothetical protein
MMRSLQAGRSCKARRRKIECEVGRSRWKELGRRLERATLRLRAAADESVADEMGCGSGRSSMEMLSAVSMSARERRRGPVDGWKQVGRLGGRVRREG